MDTKPGAKIRISQAGLNYGANVALEILTARLGNLSIPDQTGEASGPVGKVEYQVTNMKVCLY